MRGRAGIDWSALDPFFISKDEMTQAVWLRVTNLGDQRRQRGGNLDYSDERFEAWDDGHIVHAPVGSFLPNPFGLHDVHGNVSEWCREWFASYTLTPLPGDGIRITPYVLSRASRGGDFQSTTEYVRVSARQPLDRFTRDGRQGVRPARMLER